MAYYPAKYAEDTLDSDAGTAYTPIGNEHTCTRMVTSWPSYGRDMVTLWARRYMG